MENKEKQSIEKQYRNKITLISFILATLVVIRHACNYKIYKLDGFFLKVQYFTTFLTDIAVPTFFILSGYLFYVSFKYSTLLSKWKKRFFSILIPYLIWSLISYLYYLVLSSIPAISVYLKSNRIEFSMKDMLLSILTGKYTIFWFLQNLMFYIVVGPIFYLVLKNKHIGYIPTLFTLIIGFILNHFKVMEYVEVEGVKWLLNGELHSYFSLYLLGAYLGANFKDKIINVKFKKTHCIISLVLIGIICFLRVMINDYATKIFSLYFIIMAIQSILLWVGLDFLRVDNCWRVFNNSFFIYCTHALILEAVEKVFLILFKNTVMGAMIDFVFAPIITLSIIILLSYVLKKYFPKLEKILCGGR